MYSNGLHSEQHRHQQNVGTTRTDGAARNEMQRILISKDLVVPERRDGMFPRPMIKGATAAKGGRLAALGWPAGMGANELGVLVALSWFVSVACQ